MFDMMHIPTVFWVFAGIAVVVLASGYAKGMGRGLNSSNNKELEEIKQRLDRIERHLDLRDRILRYILWQGKHYTGLKPIK